MITTKFQINWPFDSGEAKISWISDLDNFSYFWSIIHPDASYQVSSQLVFRFMERCQNLIFKMTTIVAILDFQLEQF